MENPPPHPTSHPPSDFEYTSPPTRWPIIFGVIAIVFGILGFLSYGFGIVQTVMMTKTGMFDSLTGEAGSDEADDMMAALTESWERWANASIGLGAVLMLLAIVLLVGGIFLVTRKPVSRPVLLAWSYAKIVFGIGSMAVQFQIQKEQTSAMMASAEETIRSSSPGAPPPAMPDMDGYMSAMMGAFFFVGVLWVVALPVLMLIWLNRDLVKADIASWR